MATQSEIASWLDLSDRQVRNLQERGILPKPKGRGTLTEKECVLAYIKYLRSPAAKAEGQEIDPDNPEKKETNDDRLKRIRADTLEFKLQIEMGRYAPVEFLSSALEQVVSQILPKLASIPSIIRLSLPDVRPSTIEKITEEIGKLQNSIADIDIALPDIDGGYEAEGEAFALADEDSAA